MSNARSILLHALGVTVSLFFARLLFPPVVWAHSGAPYPVLLEEPVGPYIASALGDPDVGVGTFIVRVTLATGEPVPTDTGIILWVRPADGHTAEAGYQAQRQVTRDGERFIAKVLFDAEGMWHVRLVVDGSAGRGETAFQVRVTPPGPGWLRTLFCLLPFLALGVLWLISALHHRMRTEPVPGRS